MERARRSSRNRHKVVEAKQNVASIDRLSALPDELICHILAFLPTKFSVATSILARRWRFLWTHVPNLDLGFEKHCSGRTSFPSIVKRVMSLHKVQNLNTFRLIYPSGCMDSEDDVCADEFETYIATAIERNVRILSLSLYVDLPQSFLTCETLVDLTLHDCVAIPSSGDISLPSLKKIHLDQLEDLEFDIPRLLSGCRVLEELIIEGTPYDESGCCVIYSPTLKRLTIDFPWDCALFSEPDYRVKINVPALRYLKVCRCSYKHVSISPLTSLNEADIWLDNVFNEVSYQLCMLKFLHNLCNVKCLKLSSRCEFPDIGVVGSYVRFDKLIKLELDLDWRFLTKFLESAHHLEVLIIREGISNSKKWIESMKERSECLLYSLRTVSVYDFKCTEQGFNMVRYILKNAQVLKRIEIHTARHGIDFKARYDAVWRLALFHRGSKECELAFS